jgi:prepilin signal peptidase PulO-like enzyme (type II secretory pathway)
MAVITVLLFTMELLALMTLARRRSGCVSFLDPIVIALTIAGSLMLAAGSRSPAGDFGIAVALACTIAGAASDRATGLIFDSVNGFGAVTIAGWAVATNRLSEAIVGGLLCALVLFALHVSTRRRGLGLGDVKLGAVIGAGAGALTGLGAIGAAFVIGAVWACVMLVHRRLRREDRVAFAPFMAAGTIVSVGIGGFRHNG